MFRRFNVQPIIDPELGELGWSRGRWRGSVTLDKRPVPLAVFGTRKEPEPAALTIARAVSSNYPSWRDDIARALLEHYEPYAEEVAAGDPSAPARVLKIDEPAGVWPHVRAMFVQAAPIDGRLAVEIGYRVAWDEEHTLGARLCEGRLIELNGSVLAP